MSNRSSVEIDYCPQCRGVWLDRGELDKIIERSDNNELDTNVRRGVRSGGDDDRGRDWDDDDDHAGRDRDWHDDDDRHAVRSGKKRRRRGFVSDKFEFGDN